VGVFIYFIHHMSISIQTNEVVARIGEELIEGVDRLFPEKTGQRVPRIPMEPPDADFLVAFDQEARPVGANADGYLQFIDEGALLALAMNEDLIVRLEQRPGDYVVASRPLALIWPGSQVTDRLKVQVHSLFVLGHQRTSDQDFEFAVNQLVEIAVRALSPGVNDPFTAIACVDHLGSALCRLASREMPSAYRHDRQTQLRVIVSTNTFPKIIDTAFNQIRQNSRSSAAVTIRLLETIAVIAGFARRPEDRGTLLRHAEMIARGAIGGLPEEQDRQTVEQRCEAVRKLCSGPA
jgi:uncharacterized membrane protein